MSTDTKNVYEPDKKDLIEAKAKALIKFLAEEPAAGLMPVIITTERGITPDVRLILIKDNNDSEIVEGTSKGDEGESDEGVTTPESPQS